MQREALGPDDRVVLVDDWYETGAQALAARELIESSGATMLGMSIVVDDLGDDVRARLGRLHSLLRADAL
jgi:adenine phosphoribosyltransferase